MWPSYSPECRKAVNTLLNGKHSLTGYRSNKAWGLPPCDWSWAYKFERELEKKFKAKHAVAVNSGTMALQAAIFAMNLPPGSEIVTTPYTFSATPASILLQGHVPVFADVHPNSYTLDYRSVAKVLSPKTRAILPVDLFGGLADYDELSRFGLPIISDHCQAVGSKRNGNYLFGEITACSGNGGKNLPMGEGGFCLTNDRAYAERMRLFISHGENFDAPFVGLNGRCPELTSVIAYHSLKDLKKRNQRRRMLATILSMDGPGEVGGRGMEIKHPWNLTEEHVFYVYPFTLHSKRVSRDLFVKRMRRKGFACSGQYTRPLHTFPALRKYQRVPMPVVEELAGKTLCLMSDLTPDKELGYAHKVARAMRESLK